MLGVAPCQWCKWCWSVLDIFVQCAGKNCQTKQQTIPCGSLTYSATNFFLPETWPDTACETRMRIHPDMAEQNPVFVRFFCVTLFVASYFDYDCRWNAGNVLVLQHSLDQKSPKAIILKSVKCLHDLGRVQCPNRCDFKVPRALRKLILLHWICSVNL